MSESKLNNLEVKNEQSITHWQNEISNEFTVAEFEPLAIQILDKYFKEDSDVDNFEVVSVKRTSKSIYGEVLVNERRVYYKLSSANNIAGELMGYRLAKDLPHKEIMKHYFDDNGVYGLYLQEYCSALDDNEGLLLCALNRELLTDDLERITILMRQCDAIFEPLGRVFQDSLTVEPCVLDGANDRFFYTRLLPGARFDEIYSNKYFNFSSIGEEISIDELFDCEIATNDRISSKTIKELVISARVNLDPKEPRVFVVSQGDMLESNLTIDGTFFDFETGGLNALAQEMSIFLCGIYFGGHYIYAKYSPLDSSFRTDAVDQFERSVTTQCHLEKDKKRLNVDIHFPFPPLKKAIIENYLSQVIEPLEAMLSNDTLLKLVDELKSAVLARVLAVKNIISFDEKDLVFSLGLIGHFFEDSKRYLKMSDFVRDKFISI